MMTGKSECGAISGNAIARSGPWQVLYGSPAGAKTRPGRPEQGLAAAPNGVMVTVRGVVMVGFLLWCILFVLCWPIAVLGLLLYPLVWLLLLPLRLVGITVGAVLALFKAIIFLPARLLGHRPGK